jgi:hypothetical protein
MLCITVKTDKEGYTIISVTDEQGAHSSYCGFDQWAFHQLAMEQGIDLLYNV